jgi:aminopeptidase N
MRRIVATVKWICLAAFAFAPAAFAASSAAERGFDVLHYAAMIEPNIAQKSLKGHARIRARLLDSHLTRLAFDRGELTIDAVHEGSVALEFEQPPRMLRVRVAAKSGDTREIDIDSHGSPRFGLQFVPERSQVYTIFSTSQWLVSVDSPDDKATLDLGVVLPEGLRAAGSGRVVGERPRGDGTVLHQWRQDDPMPTYTFGFAAGRFTEFTQKTRGIEFRYLGEQLSSDDLGRAFRETPDMIAFFEQRAGVRYQAASYQQVLVASTIGQEASGFALLSDAYGQNLLKEPEAVSLSAHEVAHQWWGNLVTCREWTHFWLNEGFATFMAAAYDEHRFGRTAYLRDIERSRVRYEEVLKAGKDRSLVFPAWDRPSAEDRTLVYQKGAYVLHQLREMLGDRVFWNGMRKYTKTYAGRSVSTPDFQRAMEASSGQGLSAFFAKWVYLTEP